MAASLKQMRTAAGLTTSQLAELAGVSRWKIDYLERTQKKTTPDIVEKLSNALKISFSDLQFLVLEDYLGDTVSLRSFRLKAGLTLEEFAIKINRSVKMVRRYEATNRVPGSDILPAISSALGVPLGSLAFLCPPDSVGNTLKDRRCQAGL